MTVVLEARQIANPGRLEQCSIALEQGQVTMLVGPNGSGKTTLLRVLAGIGDYRGEIDIAGETLANAVPTRRAGLLSFMGASRDVHWPLSVQDYVTLGMTGDTAVRQDQAGAAISEVGMTGFCTRRMDALSTGERTRAMLARALAPKASVLLLDEPCANLDPEWQLAVIDTLRKQASEGVSILISVHDLDLAIDYADRVIVVSDGRIVADGAPATALDAETIADVFGIARGRGTAWRRVDI